MSKVTVVVPNWNGKEYLERCLLSLKAQTLADLEVIVIDNGSTDGSIPFLRRIFPEIRVRAFRSNTGFCHAVNTGIRMSSSPYVILLNNDTEADPSMAEELVKAIERHPDAFACQAKMLRMSDPQTIDDAGDLYCALGWAFARGRGRSESGYDSECRIFAACGGAAIYRREIFDEIGLFDEKHFAYLEDLDICWRARIRGYKTYYAPAARVLHAGSAATGAKYNKFKVTHSARNSVWVIRKNMPLGQKLINLPFLAAGFLTKTVFFFRKGLGMTYLKGLWQGMTAPLDGKKTVFEKQNLGRYLAIQADLWANLARRLKERA